MKVEDGWTFAKSYELSAVKMPDVDKIYQEALNTRDNKRKMYDKAINAALENLMSWERMARADGFDVIVASDMHQGAPHPVFDGDKITFIQAYAAMVVESDKSKEDK